MKIIGDLFKDHISRYIIYITVKIRVVDGFICLPLVQHCFGQILCGDSMTLSFNCTTVHGSNALSVEPKGFDVQVIMDNIIFYILHHFFCFCSFIFQLLES